MQCVALYVQFKGVSVKTAGIMLIFFFLYISMIFLYSVFIKIFYIDQYSAFGKYSHCFSCSTFCHIAKLIKFTAFAIRIALRCMTGLYQGTDMEKSRDIFLER